MQLDATGPIPEEEEFLRILTGEVDSFDLLKFSFACIRTQLVACCRLGFPTNCRDGPGRVG
ncbi:MAG: hypothetical protein A3G75_03330 [Verrucomicrobia bacterium RIFCSPLOWO2_12_FULL_64_8]|nr:MAG: hypothetical protein A3G75_03330 [Verrucomicrobia bacterium RIFCSPLOWO2_12_FULL_64_8]